MKATKVTLTCAFAPNILLQMEIALLEKFERWNVDKGSEWLYNTNMNHF